MKALMSKLIAFLQQHSWLTESNLCVQEQVFTMETYEKKSPPMMESRPMELTSVCSADRKCHNILDTCFLQCGFCQGHQVKRKQCNIPWQALIL